MRINFILYVVSIFLSILPIAQAKVVIFACEPEWAALAHEIGGETVSVITATHGKQDPHHIEARPSLIAAARQANLVIGTGAELEAGWLPMVLQKANQARIQKGRPGYLLFAEFLNLKKHSDFVASGRMDRAMGDIHPEGNPHIQLDPRVYLVASKVLAKRLSELDPDNTARYHQNERIFYEKWERYLQHWAKRAEPLKGMKVVVYHDNWVYLNDWLGLVQVTTLEPKPGIPPSAAHLKTVLQKTQQTDVKAILRTPFEQRDATKWLNQQTGIPVIELPFTVGGNKRAQDLAGLFEDTLDQLLQVRLKK